jgi:hypothetical protein
MAQFYSTLLQTLIDWTDAEIAAGKKFLDWNEVSINWEEVDLHWEDVFILLQRRGGGGQQRGVPQKEDSELNKLYQEGNPWKKLNQLSPEKSEKLIKVICKMRGIEYSSISEKNDSIRVLVNDFIRKENNISVKVKF